MMSQTVNEMETKLSALENQNFELKMKIYYLVNKQSKTDENDTSSIDSPTNNNNETLLKQKDDEIVALKDTNRILRCQISDLQADLVQLRLKLTAVAANHANAVNSNSNALVPLNANTNQFEENRRKEKEATLALVQHDEYIIKQLQEEIRSLRTQHIHDSEVLGECAEKNTILTGTIHNLEVELKESNQLNLDLKQQVGLYKDQLRRQDILLMKDIHKSQIEIDNPSLSWGVGVGSGVGSSIHNSPVRNSDGLYQHSVVSPLKEHNNIGLGLESNSTSSPSPNPNSNLLSPTQAHLQSLLFDQSQSNINMNSSKSPTPLKTNANVGVGVSATNSPLRMKNNGFLDFGAQTAWDELHQLRLDKATLIQSLTDRDAKYTIDLNNWDKERVELEDTLQVAAEELDHCETKYHSVKTKYESLKKKYRAGEAGMHSLQDRILELQQQRDESFVKFDLEASHSMSLHRAALSKQKTSKRRDSVNMNSGNSHSNSNRHQESLSFSPSATTTTVTASREDEKETKVLALELESELEQSIQAKKELVEQYRKRETELLTALEGVVKRCQELENFNKRSGVSHSNTHVHE